MKRFFTLSILTIGLLTISANFNSIFGQSVSINSTGNAPNLNSILDVSSTTSGALLPRMNTSQRTTLGGSLAGPEEGMTVFDTQLNAYFYWDGGAWVRILSANAVSLDAAYDGGTPNSGNGRVIDADQGPVVIQSSSGNSLEVDAGIQVAEDQWIGIGAAAERFVFDGSGNLIGLENADLTIDDGNWIGFDASNPRIQFDDSDNEIEILDAELGIGTEDPEYLLDVFAAGVGAELVMAKFEAQRASGNGATTGIKIVGDRVNSTPVAYIDFDNRNNTGADYTMAKLVSYGTGNGRLGIELGDGAGGLNERMALDNAGNLQLDGLIEATPSVVTSTAAGVLESLPIGSNDDVLQVSGGTITWGPATVSTLPLANLGGGANGDVLYHNGSNWVPLSPPGSAAPAGEVYTLTLPNAGSGPPSWSQSGNYTSDNLGNHIATQNLELATFAIAASDGIVNIDDNLAINGKVVSDGINETSDGRFKKNINLIENALDLVLNLEGVTYNWRTDEYPEKKFTTAMEYGVIAQQIEKYVPELVHTDAASGYKSVQYSHMVPLLIEAIKEQNTLLSKQDSEISELKASVEMLSDHIRTTKK